MSAGIQKFTLVILKIDKEKTRETPFVMVSVLSMIIAASGWSISFII